MTGTSPNHQRFRLGRKARLTDSRTLQFSKYATTLASPPSSIDYTKGITSYGVALNDQLGDCVIAGIDHAIQIWTANTGTEQTTSDQTVENYYQWWCQYVPGDPSTDNGCVELFTLKSWLKHKFNGHRLRAFANADPQNLTQVKQAIQLFGLVYIGFSVPQSVMDNANDPSIPWDIGGDETIIGGHCVVIPKYDAEFLYPVSWGSNYRMTPQFFARFVDEVHVLLSEDWFNWNQTGLSASGFAFDQLWSDLSEL